MKPTHLTDSRRRALDKLLAGYLECPIQEQAEYIERCQRRWPRLSRWLDALIERSQTISLMDQSFTRLAGEAIAAAGNQPAQELETGFKLGPWQVVERVGEGGMGMVYRGARADGAFEMDVAIKLLKLRGHGLGEYLQQECRFLARLNHPGITRLLDAGLDRHAGPFLVMEWIDGMDLGQWLESSRPGFARRLALFTAIVEAIGHAHGRLIVHGDIKPDNIRIDRDGLVKVMDFGVARMIDAGDGGNRIRGLTPNFAAPEQLTGDSPTPQSDMWALGALLFWLLTGRYMPRQPDNLAGLLASAKVKRSQEMAALIGKACARDPEARYRNAGELLDDLERFDHFRPLRAMPDSRAYRLGRLIRRNPVPVAGITATFLALTAGLLATTSMYLEAERAWQAAAMRQAEAEARTMELEQVAAFQEQQLGQISPEQLGAVIRHNLLEQREDLSASSTDGPITDVSVEDLEAALVGINFTDTALESLDRTFFEQTRQTIDEKFANQPAIRARLLQTLASTLKDLGRHDQALTPQTTAYKLRHQELGQNHPDTLNSARELGRLHNQLQDHDRSRELLQQALDAQLQHLGTTHPDTLLTRRAMASLKSSLQKYDQAEAYFSTALEGQRQELGERHPETLSTLNMLGLLYVDRGRPAEAFDYLEQAYEGRKSVLGHHHPETLSSLNNLGITAAALGDYQRAEEIHRQIAGIRENTLGSEHPDFLRSLSNLGFAIQQQGRLEEADRLHRRALEGRIRVLGEQHSDSWISMNHLALTLTSLDQHDQAQVLYRRALEIAREHYGPTHRKTLATASNLSISKQRTGDHEAAVRLSGESARNAQEHLGSDNWITGAMLINHARALKASGQYRQATTWAESAHEILARTLGEEHPRTIAGSELLAKVYQRRYMAGEDERFRQQARQWEERARTEPD